MCYCYPTLLHKQLIKNSHINARKKDDLRHYKNLIIAFPKFFFERSQGADEISGGEGPGALSNSTLESQTLDREL